MRLRLVRGVSFVSACLRCCEFLLLRPALAENKFPHLLTTEYVEIHVANAPISRKC